MFLPKEQIHKICDLKSRFVLINKNNALIYTVRKELLFPLRDRVKFLWILYIYQDHGVRKQVYRPPHRF